MQALRVQRKLSSFFAFGILLATDVLEVGTMGSWKKSSCGPSVEQPGVSVQHLTEGINFSLNGEVFYFLTT